MKDGNTTRLTQMLNQCFLVKQATSGRNFSPEKLRAILWR
jgi:hypothetical protein